MLPPCYRRTSFRDRFDPNIAYRDDNIVRGPGLECPPPPETAPGLPHWLSAADPF